MTDMKLDEHGMPEGWLMQDGWEISPRQVQAELSGDDQVLLLDCRTAKEHATAAIPEARLIPMQELPDRLDEIQNWADRKVVAFCHAGVRSMKVTVFLRERGFEDVKSMAGGIDLWSRTVDDSVPRY